LRNIKIEDTVILIDCSRSMIRKDFKPNRLIVGLQSAKNFIQTKLSTEIKDRISILTFGNNPKKLCDFAFEEEKLIDSLKKIQISGKGKLHNGIAFALQLLVKEMRKIGGKLSRIFIVSDNKLSINATKLDKIATIAKGLGVYIDVCQLGVQEEYKENLLKQICQFTGGEHAFFLNSRAAINAGKAFASKKEVKDTTDYFSPEKKDKNAPFISEIALPLRRPTIMEIRSMLNGKYKSQDKCQICHSIKAPTTGIDFHTEGRYCPSCDRAMHLSCAAMWAKKTEYKEHVFRCPFCFFLLELPKAALRLIKDQDRESQDIKIIEDEEKIETKMILIPENDINQIDASCSYCHNIFLGDFKVYQCEACSSYYHEPCLQKMVKEISACRNCGSKITST